MEINYVTGDEYGRQFELSYSEKNNDPNIFMVS